MDKLTLNVAAWCKRTSALGPGIRAVVWVQGCPFRCKGCIAPDWIPIKPAQQYSPSDLAELLLSDPEVNGITLSGGEPILQASALVELIFAAKAIRDIDIILYTGYYYENLKAFPDSSPASRLLSRIDVLIEGPYEHTHNDNRGLRGSSNQRVIHLTQRLTGFDFINQPRQSEIIVSNGELLFVGVPAHGAHPDSCMRLDLPVSHPKVEEMYERA